jgi:hypothetical protein
VLRVSCVVAFGAILFSSHPDTRLYACFFTSVGSTVCNVLQFDGFYL